MHINKHEAYPLGIIKKNSRSIITFIPRSSQLFGIITGSIKQKTASLVNEREKYVINWVLFEGNTEDEL